MRIPKENFDKIKALIFKALDDDVMPAYDAVGSCLYRDTEGHACGIGALIPEDYPHLADIADCEGSIDAVISELGADVMLGLPVLQGVVDQSAAFDFLYDLQEVHDDTVHGYYATRSRYELKKRYRATRSRYELQKLLRDRYTAFFQSEETV